jgi:hypothetical protein
MWLNNAGYGLGGPLEGLTDDQILRMVNANMFASSGSCTCRTPNQCRETARCGSVQSSQSLRPNHEIHLRSRAAEGSYPVVPK